MQSAPHSQPAVRQQPAPRPQARPESTPRPAEDNLIERLQNAGLLAPEGEVDKVLETVADNLLNTKRTAAPWAPRSR